MTGYLTLNYFLSRTRQLKRYTLLCITVHSHSAFPLSLEVGVGSSGFCPFQIWLWLFVTCTCANLGSLHDRTNEVGAARESSPLVSPASTGYALVN